MNKILLLTKVFLKSSIQFNYNTAKEPAKPGSATKKAILYGVLFAYLMGIFGFLSYGIINTLIQFEQETLFIGLYLFIIIIITVVQTLFSGMNLFYFSKDIEHVLPLPIKPFHLLMAKTNVLLITEYFVEILFAVAPMIIYGVLTGSGALYYLFSIIVMLVIPIIPIIVVMLVVMVIMSVSNLVKYKERFQLFANIIIIGLAIGSQFIGNLFTEQSEEAILNVISSANSLVGMLGNYFLTLKPAINTIISINIFDNLISLGQIVLITLAGIAVYILIGQKLYLKGVVGNSSTATKKIKNIDKHFIKRKVNMSYVLKEIKILYRNPVYLVQCILPVFLLPCIFLIGYIATPENGLEEIKKFGINNSLGICIVVTAINFLYSMNFISVTAISRDGNYAIFTKYIPIPFYKQFIYKILPNFVLNIFPTIFVLALVTLVFNASITFCILAFVVAMLTNIIQSMLMLIVDLKRPKLSWNNEYAVVKQNMNMIFEFALMFILVMVLMGLGIIFMNMNYYIPIAILTIIFVIAGMLINNYVKKNASKLFEKIM